MGVEHPVGEIQVKFKSLVTVMAHSTPTGAWSRDETPMSSAARHLCWSGSPPSVPARVQSSGSFVVASEVRPQAIPRPAHYVLRPNSANDVCAEAGPDRLW